MAITRDSLLSLEAYAKTRSGFRERVLAIWRQIFDQLNALLVGEARTHTDVL